MVSTCCQLLLLAFKSQSYCGRGPDSVSHRWWGGGGGWWGRVQNGREAKHSGFEVSPVSWLELCLCHIFIVGYRARSCPFWASIFLGNTEKIEGHKANKRCLCPPSNCVHLASLADSKSFSLSLGLDDHLLSRVFLLKAKWQHPVPWFW